MRLIEAELVVASRGMLGYFGRARWRRILLALAALLSSTSSTTIGRADEPVRIPTGAVATDDPDAGSPANSRRESPSRTPSSSETSIRVRSEG